MSHLSVFFNNQIIRDNDIAEASFNIGYLSTFLGEVFLTPVRYVFEGNVIVVGLESECCKKVGMRHYRERYFHSYLFGSVSGPLQKMLKTVGVIVSFVIGLPFGIIFKGLGYLSAGIRERHRLVVMHYTPVDRTVGTDEGRLDLEGITKQLRDLDKHNHLSQRTNVLKIWALPGTLIKEDPGILRLVPQKVILIGAKLVHGPSNIGCLDEKLSPKNWSDRVVKTVKEAEEHTPPKMSFFSFARKRMFYFVQP